MVTEFRNGPHISTASNVYESMDMKQPFEQVVVEHSATVLRVCRFVAGLNDADDAWTETFISAMRAYPDLPSNANVQAWLVTIAHHRSIDQVRKESRQATPSADPPDRESTIGLPHDQQHEIWADVEALPPRQRQAIAYHYFGGLSFKATAEILGSTPEAARKAASDGIKTLRTRITKSSSKEAHLDQRR